MSLFHGRWSEQVALLASGTLRGEELRAAEAHCADCADCARELEELRTVVDSLAGDPLCEEPFPLALSALESRVLARLDAEPLRDAPAEERASSNEGRSQSRGVGRMLAAAAALTALAVWGLQGRPKGTEDARPVAVTSVAPAMPAASPLPEPVLISEETLVRLERNLARQRTARYLSEAEDVLVTVASTPQRCARGKERVDMADEARRSRELLARRSLVVDPDAESTSQAQALLDDVEQVLRDVAALPACARQNDLLAIHRDLSRRRLLMKIDLMTRELQG